MKSEGSFEGDSRDGGRVGKVRDSSSPGSGGRGSNDKGWENMVAAAETIAAA
jgi:hypothetical protein